MRSLRPRFGLYTTSFHSADRVGGEEGTGRPLASDRRVTVPSLRSWTKPAKSSSTCTGASAEAPAAEADDMGGGGLLESGCCVADDNLKHSTARM